MLRRYVIIALGSWLLAFGQEPGAKSQKPEKALWDEYGLQDVQQIGHATAYRLKDPTGAFAAFQWQRPENAHSSKLAALAAETPDHLLVAHGNYLLRFDAPKPSAAELKTLVENLPRLEQGTLPALSGYLPAHGLVPNSEKYVLGPESLAKFAPQITPSVAGFHLGAEAQVARFRSKSGVLNLAVFSYPTPQIARQRVPGFEALPGLMVKRSGPLIAVVPSPGNADDAEKLLSRVNYQAIITWDQYVPTKRDNIGVLVINCFILIGILIGFGAVGGLAFGGFRAMYRRLLGLPEAPDPIITLGLQNK